MKRIKKVQENGFYVFCGRSNANSCFIEKLSHAKTFLIYANYFLKGYLTIYEYLITKDGWTMVVKIKNKNSIILTTHYQTDQLWEIISERIRLFISTFVRVTNKTKGRTGSLVHSSYERYYFETLGESKKYIERIRNQQIKLYAKKKKYRGLKTHYKIPNKLGKGSIFLCSKELKSKRFGSRKMSEVFEFVALSELVAQKMINSTIINHTPPNTPHSFPSRNLNPLNSG